MRILISSILLALIILLPVGRKCEIRFKNILILALIVGILTGFSTLCLRVFAPLCLCAFVPFLIELCFLFLFTAIIGLYRFYRDPERIPPATEGIILSPADGFIRYIKHPPIVGAESPCPDDSWTIAITMTYLDVHIIRSPINGVVSSIEKKGDKFLSLKKEAAVNLNAQVHIAIVGADFPAVSGSRICGDICDTVGTNSIRAKDFQNLPRYSGVKLILIASRLVRKILVWVKEEQKVKKGTRLGKIVFGSQCNIIIPSLAGLKIEVQEKQQVYAGLTVLARY